MNDFVEIRIINAVRNLLSGRVNEIIGDWQAVIPLIEFGNYQDNSVLVPSVTLVNCEKTEKERIIRLDAYLVNITFSFPEVDESELFCYAYCDAINKAINEDRSIGGVADRSEIIRQKYMKPKIQYCGESWGLEITLRITVEGRTY